MNGALFLVWSVLCSPSPLQRAVQCYENLDYACAENALSESLGGALTETERLEAWRYEALIAMAWRDLERARRAVKAIYALDGRYEPKDVPPDLIVIFEAEKPPPLPASIWEYEGRYILQWPTDDERDARWWMTGQGVQLGLLLVRPQGSLFHVRFGYVRHPAQDLNLGIRTLRLVDGKLGMGRWWSWNALRVTTGVGGGVKWAITDINPVYEQILETSETDAFVGATLSFEFDLSYRVWNALSVTFSIAPELLIRNYQEQPHLSYFLPFLVGLRYGG